MSTAAAAAAAAAVTDLNLFQPEPGGYQVCLTLILLLP